MKKFLLYFVGFVIIFFIAPAICTATPKNAQKEAIAEIEKESETKQTEEKPEEKNDSIKIKLIHSDSGTVEELSLDEYLYGVVSAEMPASYETEALSCKNIYNLSNKTQFTKAWKCRYMRQLRMLSGMDKQRREIYKVETGRGRTKLE
mgnify:CR=1 FL=1